MITEYKVHLENKTKDELVAFILQLQKQIDIKEKQIDLMAEFIYAMWCDYPMKITKRLKDNGFDDKECGTCESKEKNCLDCLEQHFKSKTEKE